MGYNGEDKPMIPWGLLASFCICALLALLMAGIYGLLAGN